LNPYIKYKKTLLFLFFSIFGFGKSNELQFKFPHFTLKQVVSFLKKSSVELKSLKGMNFDQLA
jgi:hypothetical protein